WESYNTIICARVGCQLAVANEWDFQLDIRPTVAARWMDAGATLRRPSIRLRKYSLDAAIAGQNRDRWHHHEDWESSIGKHPGASIGASLPRKAPQTPGV